MLGLLEKGQSSRWWVGAVRASEAVLKVSCAALRGSSATCSPHRHLPAHAVAGQGFEISLAVQMCLW